MWLGRSLVLVVFFFMRIGSSLIVRFVFSVYWDLVEVNFFLGFWEKVFRVLGSFLERVNLIFFMFVLRGFRYFFLRTWV